MQILNLHTVGSGVELSMSRYRSTCLFDGLVSLMGELADSSRVSFGGSMG